MGVALGLGLVLAMVSTSHAAVTSVNTAIGKNDLLFSIPIGKNGVSYQGVGGPGEKLGPKALAVAPDGSFWITDTLANRLLHYAARGRLLQVVNLDGLMVAPRDIEVTGSSILALGSSLPCSSAPTPLVLRLSPTGKLLARYPIPADFEVDLWGMALGSRGEVLLERGESTIVQLVDAKGKPALTPLPGYPNYGQTYKLGRASATDRFRGYVTAGATRVEIVATNGLLGLNLLGVDPDRSFYVAVSENISVPYGPLRIGQTVRHYSSKGALLRTAHMPVMDQVTPVEHALSIGPNKAVYALITRTNRAEVRQLMFAR
jgi:hypothetical protein